MIRTATPHRRSSQLAILREACAVSAEAWITRHCLNTGTAQGRLRELTRSSVLVELADERSAPRAGECVTVQFDLSGCRYRFLTDAQKTFRPAGEQVTCSHVRVPACVERWDRRARPRREAPASVNVPIRLERIASPSIVIPAKLSDASEGGIGTIVDSRHSDQLLAGGLFWAEFPSGDGSRRFHIVVRPVNYRRLSDDRVRVGWQFQATDYPELLASQRVELWKLLGPESGGPGEEVPLHRDPPEVSE